MFYSRLIGLCDKHRIKPTALVRKLGLSPSMPKRWENGAKPKSDALQKISDYFGVTVDYLIGTDIAAQKEPAYHEINGLKDTRYYELSPENQKLVDQMIEKLYKSQSAD